MEPKCEYCDKPIDPVALGVFRFVEGWEQIRSGGGTHAISDPTRHERWRHSWCHGKVLAGISADQESLLA